MKEREDHHVNELSEIQLQANSYEQQLHFSKENETRVREEIERLEYDLEEIRDDADEREDMLMHIEDRIAQTHEKIHDLEKSIMDGEVELKTIQQREKQKNLQYKHSIEERESLSRHMAALDKELYRLQSGKDKLDEKIQSLTDYMWESYEMTYRMAKEQWKDEITLSDTELKKEISKWKNRIKGLGSININAIEEYKDAIKDFDKVIELEPNFPDAYYNKAVSINHLGIYDEAIEYYDKAIELNPNYSESYCNRAISKSKMAYIQKDKISSEEYNKLIKESEDDFEKAYTSASNNNIKAIIKEGIKKLASLNMEAAVNFCKKYNI